MNTTGMNTTRHHATIYQVIKKGDGTFYPNIKNEINGEEFGAWNGYCKTYEEALKQLQQEILDNEKWIRENTKEVVYEVRR